MFWLVSVLLKCGFNGRRLSAGIEINRGSILNSMEACAGHDRSEVGVINLSFHKNLRRSIQ